MLATILLKQISRYKTSEFHIDINPITLTGNVKSFFTVQYFPRLFSLHRFEFVNSVLLTDKIVLFRQIC